jgi:hypothetical protein
LAVFLAGARLGTAQEAAVRSEVDARKIGLEDLVQWSLTLEGPALRLEEEVSVPPLKNLKVVGGPSVSTQISLVNSRMSQQKVYTWILQPTATGTAEIGTVRVKFVGGEATAAAITVEVGPGSVRGKAAPRGTSPFGPDPFGPDPFEDMFGPRRKGAEGKLFVETVPSRTRARVGEALLVTIFIYARGVQPRDVQWASPPQYPGFWVENLEGSETPKGEQVKVDGETFVRFPVYRRLLFPTKAGALTIPALSLRVALARQSLFDSGMVVERATKAVKVTVDPVPDAPDFTGAVGRFKAEAAAEPAALRLGEAATVRFRLEGVGNLKWVDKGPRLELPGAKVFPPQVKSNLQARTDGIAGSRTWEYVVVPETSGHMTIPPLSFTYFDPAADRMVKAETSPLALEVQAGDSAAVAAAPSAAVRPRGRSVLALRDALEVGTETTLTPRRLLFLLLWAAVLHAGLAFSGRVGLFRAALARGPERSAIQQLDRAAAPGLAKEEAAALIEKALQEALTGRDGKADPEREQVVARLVEEVQALRYAPQLGDYSDKVQDLAQRAREAVRRWA